MFKRRLVRWGLAVALMLALASWLITHVTAKRVTVGMTRTEVERVLGEGAEMTSNPPGDQDRRVFVFLDGEPGRWDLSCVAFDARDIATEVSLAPQPSLVARLRAWLGW